MRLSNKLLLATVLFVALVVALHFVSLAVMRAMGWHTEIFEPKTNPIKSFYPENIKAVRLKGIAGVKIMMSDTFAYALQTGSGNFFKSEIRNDTLFLRGDTIRVDTVYRKKQILRIDTFQVHFQNWFGIYTTGNEKILAEKSNLEYQEGDEDGRFNLELTSSTFQANYRYDSLRHDASDSVKIIESIIIRADNSTVSFSGDIEIHNMELSLSDGSEYNNNYHLKTVNGTIWYSDESSFVTRGRPLKNLKMIYRKWPSSVKVETYSYDNQYIEKTLFD